MILILIGSRLFFRWNIFNNTLSKKCIDKDLTGFDAIITGANRGIGYETTKSMVSYGCNVILACHNESNAKQAILS